MRRFRPRVESLEGRAVAGPLLAPIDAPPPDPGLPPIDVPPPPSGPSGPAMTATGGPGLIA